MGRKQAWEPFVFGGLASVTAECGTFPIDTTKTRLQVQGQKIDARLTQLKYNGMIHALFRIFREEGLPALYSGIAPALLRQASYGTIKIGVYHYLKRVFAETEQDESLPVNVFCGIIAGVVSSSVANPTDVLKTRLMNQRKLKTSVVVNGGMAVPAIYTSSLDCLTQTVKTEGMMALYKGFIPNWVRLGPWNIIFFMTYEQLKKLPSS